VKFPPKLGPSAAELASGRFRRITSRDLYRLAGQSAVLVAALILGVVVVSNLTRSLAGAAPNNGPGSRATAAASASPDISWFSTLPFNCLGGTGIGTGSAATPAQLAGVRADTHSGYDRVTIQFAGGPPAETGLTAQDGAQFVEGPSGKTVTLKGQHGALVTLHNTDGHTNYGGPTDIVTGSPVVLELRRVQDFEGTVQWAIGLSRAPCYRMAFVDKPTRLIIDFRAGK